MKQIIASFLIFTALFTGIFLGIPQETKADCEHIFVTEYRGGIKVLVEYDCDGSVVNVTVLED
jgi:hypothetical protein